MTFADLLLSRSLRPVQIAGHKKSDSTSSAKWVQEFVAVFTTCHYQRLYILKIAL